MSPPPHAQVCEVCKVVDAELGYADSVPVFRQGSKVGVGGDDCVLGVDTYILVVSGKLDEHCCSLKKG